MQEIRSQLLASRLNELRRLARAAVHSAQEIDLASNRMTGRAGTVRVFQCSRCSFIRMHGVTAQLLS